MTAPAEKVIIIPAYFREPSAPYGRKVRKPAEAHDIVVFSENCEVGQCCVYIEGFMSVPSDHDCSLYLPPIDLLAPAWHNKEDLFIKTYKARKFSPVHVIFPQSLKSKGIFDIETALRYLNMGHKINPESIKSLWIREE